ncbi:hypothetical protein [Psychrobacillus psychrotolerans]|uniref:hypothetical protein n=1 Tax=Psychrobacillus TaxID=1221880 RepID=UPI0033163B9E
MYENDYPKVIVVSHNPFSENQNNGKTLLNFFKGWPKENISQLHFSMENPSYLVCENYYRILDLEILKKYFRQQNKVGSITGKNEDVNNKKTKLNNSSIYTFIKKIFQNNFPSALLFRDFLWNKDYWKTSELVEWIDNQNPDLVFYQSSNCPFSFKIVKWICEERNIPLIMQTTDDYVTAHFSIDPFYWIHHFKIKKQYKWAVGYSNYVIAIGDLMEKEYKNRFGGSYKVAMNSVTIPDSSDFHNSSNSGKIKFLFAGNLGLNRWKVIVKIAEALKVLETEGIYAELEIYSLAVPPKNILDKMNLSPNIGFRGSLNQEELDRKVKNSDVLIHVEAFDRKNRNITRLSISTKIPEYMRSNRCIFAVGPNDVASMQYIEKNNLGVVLNTLDKSHLKSNTKELINNSELRRKYAENAMTMVKERHSIGHTNEMIRKIVSESVNSKGIEV